MTKSERYGLNYSTILAIVNSVEKYAPKVEILLFGSRAKGNFSNGSDIDIALKGKCLNLNILLDIYIELDKYDLPYKFDFIIFDRINDKSLMEHIDRVGINLENSIQNDSHLITE
jgi:predicted nucleotidyltransferase